MSKQYFNNFPKIDYIINGTTYNAVDMSVRFKVIEGLMSRPDAYYEYTWSDEDRVDIVADKYYGDVDYAWVVMLSARVFDWMYDLPMTPDTFDRYLKSKYNTDDPLSLSSKIHHYEDLSGLVIDKATYDVMGEFNKAAINIYDYEFMKNEKKRNIKLLSKKHLRTVVNELELKLQDIKNTRRLLKTE